MLLCYRPDDEQGTQVFEKLLTRNQLAERLGVSPSFISKMMNVEDLPYVKLGRAVRFRVWEVAVWLQKRSRP
jgi:excisionase family DNA binding protein